MRNWDRDNPIADAHDYANRDIPSRGKCVVCKEPIPTWDLYYQIEDDLVCDDCIFDYVKRFRRYPE